MPISSPRVCPVLVARAAELTALDNLLADAQSGQGRIVLLMGEAGIGKSRLAAEVASRATDRGFQVLEGGCLEREGDFPFAPFVDAMRRDTTSEARSGAAATILSDLLAPDGGSGHAPAGHGKQRLYDQIATMLAARAARQPLLVVVEDVHWADPTSLELLEVLPRRLTNSRAFILCTTRPDAANQDLQRWLTALRRARALVELSVPPLDEDAVGQMVAALAGGPPSRILSIAVYAQTDGNPFFVEELLAAVPSRERLDWLLDDPAVPVRIQDVIQRQTEGLPDAAQRVIDFAAVAGHEVEYDVLLAGLDLPPTSVLSALRTLVGRQLLIETRRDGTSSFAFRHALTRDAIRARLLGPERQALHRIVAQSKEQSFSPGQESVEVAGELGYHFHAAGMWDRALPHAERASDAAWSIGATVEALRHGRRALDAASKLDDPRAESLSRRCGQAYSRLGMFEEARNHLEAACSLARAHHRVDAELAALDDLADLYASRDYTTAKQFAQSAVELARRSGDSGREARALNRLGNVYTNLGRFDEGRTMHEAALHHFEALGDRWGTADSWDLIGMTRYLAGEVPEARHAFDHAVRIFADLGDAQRVASARTSRGLYLAVLDGMCATDASPATYRDDATEGLRLCQKIGWRAGEAYALVALACADLGDGRYADAQERAELALAIAEEIEHDQWQVIALITLGILAADLADRAGALARFRQAAEIARAAGAAQWLERIEAWMMALQGGDRDAVPAPSIDPVRPPRSIGQRRVYVAHAERALSAGQHGMALAFADALLFGAAGPQAAAVLQLRGEALAAMGRTADADAAFLDARRRGIAVGPRPLLWKVAAARSRLWRNDDRTLSRQEADLARSELASLTGAMPEVRRGPFLASPAVRPWARPAAQHGTAIQTGTGGLTPREREVTILITRGLSNKEAARELGLSEKTVEMHVSSCLGKLGFASRAQLAAWAVANQLVDPTSPQG